MNIPIYKCSIDENDESGIFAMSFVESPAVEVNFVALENQEIKLNKNEMKQILTGVILQPNQLIYRLDENNNPYYITFSEEDIEKIAQKMMKSGVALYNTTHQHQSKLSNNYLTELWIVNNPDNDKSNDLGFKNLPKGTLMASYKIEDKEYWDSEVMTGNVKGFSLEAFFNQELKLNKIIKKYNKNNTMKKKKDTLLQRFAKFILEIEDVQKVDTTDSGVPVVIYQLADGSEFTVDVDGYATLEDGTQMPAGEHKLSDGNVAVISEDGQLVETKSIEVSNDQPAEVVAPQIDEFAEEPTEEKPTEEEPIEEKDTITINDVEYEVPIAVADYVKELEGKKDEVEKEIVEMKKVTPSVQPINLNRKSHSDKPLQKWEIIAEALRNK